MALNGIDISNWQKGINLAAVPADFVICKATEGTTYVSPDCDRQYQQAKANGRCLGVYHFATGGSSGQAEADWFLKNIQGYIGEAVLILDWESNALPKGPSYAKAFLDRVYQKTGVRPLIYMSNSVIHSYDWSSVVAGNYGLWNAGYYAGYQTMGYNPNAPLKGGTGAWKSAAMYQYTSSGRLSGYSGNLDLNVFYGDRNAWSKYANPGNPAGWVKDSVGWWYKNADGSYPRSCWKEIGGDWYYFDERGYALSEQWFQDGGFWYYLKGDCRMAKGWIKLGDTWFYLRPTAATVPVGSMATGWLLIDGFWYFLSPEYRDDVTLGGMLTGFFDDGDYTYYCRPTAENGKPEGSMVSGWLKLEDSWYYCNKDNDCQPVGSVFKNHWHTENNKRYYLKDDGKMACNETLVISGKEYSFDSSGKQV